MNNLCISQVNARPSFGAVKLGRGGAEVMADRLFIKNAKAFISGQSRFNTTVLVSKDAVEVIPVEQNLIFKVTGQFRRSPKKHYLDVAVEEHGEKAYIRIPRNVKNTELYEYGKENTQFTLARIIANEMDNNAKWLSELNFKPVNVESENVSKTVSQKISEKEREKDINTIKKLALYS